MKLAGSFAHFPRKFGGISVIALDLLEEQFAGDIKKLEGSRNHYRLRIGGHRVLFRMNADVIEVYAVKQRKNAYE